MGKRKSFPLENQYNCSKHKILILLNLYSMFFLNLLFFLIFRFEANIRFFNVYCFSMLIVYFGLANDCLYWLQSKVS